MRWGRSITWQYGGLQRSGALRKPASRGSKSNDNPRDPTPNPVFDLVLLMIYFIFFYFLFSFLIPKDYYLVLESLIKRLGIYSPEFVISYECSGFVSISLMLAILLILKTNKKEKITLGIVYSLILWVFNMVRIISIYTFREYFEFIHVLGWFLMSFIVFLLFFLTLKYKT